MATVIIKDEVTQRGGYFFSEMSAGGNCIVELGGIMDLNTIGESFDTFTIHVEEQELKDQEKLYNIQFKFGSNCPIEIDCILGGIIIDEDLNYPTIREALAMINGLTQTQNVTLKFKDHE